MASSDLGKDLWLPSIVGEPWPAPPRVHRYGSGQVEGMESRQGWAGETMGGEKHVKDPQLTSLTPCWAPAM